MNPKTGSQKRLYIEGRLALYTLQRRRGYAILTRPDFAPAYIMLVESGNIEAVSRTRPGVAWPLNMSSG